MVAGMKVAALCVRVVFAYSEVVDACDRVALSWMVEVMGA